MNKSLFNLIAIGLSLFATQAFAVGKSTDISKGLSPSPLKILIKYPPVTPYCSHPKWIKDLLSSNSDFDTASVENYVQQFVFKLDGSRKNRWVDEDLFYSSITDLIPPIHVDRILVEKSKKKLHLLANGGLVKTYNISLGFSPTGHKAQEGDGKTPEGIYKIEYKNLNSDFHLSLKISYPNEQDEYFAKNHKVKPGGFIMVHGFPKDENERKKVEIVHGRVNWTEGCMGMTNSEIEEVFSLVAEGTPIEICQ